MLPLENKIVIGYESSIDESITLYGNKYPFYWHCHEISFMNEQCLRQYIRSIIAKIYTINIYDDLVMYIMMAINMQVTLSDIDDKYKDTFRKLSIVMLKKKRMNSDMTIRKNRTRRITNSK